jgi:hypothetical protein
MIQRGWGRDRDFCLLRRADRVEARAQASHGPLARCHVGILQSRAGSMAEASRSRSLLPDSRWREMRRRAIRSGGLSPPSPRVCRPIALCTSGEGPIDIKVGRLAQNGVTRPRQLVRPRLDGHHAIGLGALALLARSRSGLAIPHLHTERTLTKTPAGSRISSASSPSYTAISPRRYHTISGLEYAGTWGRILPSSRSCSPSP